MKFGDIVLLKDLKSYKNNWLFGMVENVICGKDGCVLKVEVCIIKNGLLKIYIRFVIEFVFFLSVNGDYKDIFNSDRE